MMGPSSFLRGGLLAALPLLSLAATPQCNGDSNAGNAASSLSGFAPASRYCTSSFPAQSTSTVTVQGVATVTSTVSTSTISSVSPTVTATSTAVGVVITQSTTVSTTVISTATVTNTQFVKRAVFRFNGTTVTRGAIATVSLSPQSSLLNSIAQGPSTFASSVCACLETVPTVTATSFSSSTTVSVTATSLVNSASTTVITTTPSTTSVSTIFQTFTSTVTATSVITSTTSTAAPTGGAVVRTNVPLCNDVQNSQDTVNGNKANTGGCSEFCYCDSRPGMTNGYCNAAASCSDDNGIAYPKCSTDADCPATSVCDNGNYYIASCGSPICVPYDRTTCPSTFGYGA